MIAASEQNHLDEITTLLEHYDIAVEAGEAGKFDNREIQKLYDDYLAKGSESLTGALQISAQVEDLDISDLLKYKDQTTNENLLLVFNNLQQGSENHLRAFTRQLAATGETYEPKHISASEYEAIVSGNNLTMRGYGYAQADSVRRMRQGMITQRNDTAAFYGRRMMPGMPFMPGFNNSPLGRGNGMMNRMPMHNDTTFNRPQRMQNDSLFRQHMMQADSAYYRQRVMRTDSAFNYGRGLRRGEGSGIGRGMMPGNRYRDNRNNTPMNRQFRNRDNNNNNRLFRNQNAYIREEQKNIIL